MALSFQDKIRPVATSTPSSGLSFADKIRPVNTGQSLGSVNPTPAKPEKSIAENFLGGMLRGFSSIGRNVQDVLPRSLSTVPNFSTGEAGKKASETLKPLDSTAGKIGNMTGELLPFLTPGGASKTAPWLAKAGIGALKNTAIGTAVTGDVKEGAVIGVGGEVLGGLTKPLASAGKTIYKSLAIPLSKGEARMVQAYKANVPFLQRVGAALSGNSKVPITADETAFRKGLMGTESMIGVQAKKATGKIWDGIISPALKASDDVDLKPIFADAKTTIIKNNPELNQQKALLKALDSIVDDYKGVTKSTMENLQDLKSGWASPVPQKAWRGEDITGAVNNVRKTLSDISRTKILTTIKDPAVKQAYIDYGNLKGLQEWGQKAMTGGKFKGGTGGFLNAAKDAILTPVATIGGQVIYKTAHGIEFISTPGMKVLHDLFNEVSPPSQQQ